MLSRSILTIVISFMFVSLFGQEHIWTKQTKVSEALAFEKSLNPDVKIFTENIVLSTEFYPLLEKHPLKNPAIVQRAAADYLPLSVEYFFTEKDSVLRFISYEWEKDKYDYLKKIENFKNESKKLSTYNKEYERIKKNMMIRFGDPVSSDTSLQEVNREGRKYYTRETVWKTGSLQLKLWMIFAPNTYRIRMSTYWKDN